MIKLIASAPFDGWAYIEEKEKYYLVKPPYKDLSNKISVEVEDVEEALNKREFYEDKMVFDSYNELFNYLIETKNKLNEKRGRDTSPINDSDILKFYSRATEEQLFDLAKKIDSELIQVNQYFIAIDFINKLITLENIQSNIDLKELFLQLNSTVEKKLQEKEERIKNRFTSFRQSNNVRSLIAKQNEISTCGQVMGV